MAESNNVQPWCVQFTAWLPSICFHLHPSWSVSKEPKEEHERLPVFTITYGFWQNDNKLGADLRELHQLLGPQNSAVCEWGDSRWCRSNPCISGPANRTRLSASPALTFPLQLIQSHPASGCNAVRKVKRWAGGTLPLESLAHRDSTSTSEERMREKKTSPKPIRFLRQKDFSLPLIFTISECPPVSPLSSAASSPVCRSGLRSW